MSQIWTGILDRVHAFHQKVAEDGVTAWFRGQRIATWPLRSRLHRYVLDCVRETGQKVEGSLLRTLIREEYKSLYRRFTADAWAILEPHQRGDWALLFAMQHQGLPTRLLDWTESFACALYFAQQERRPHEDAALFLANPDAVNQVSTGESGLIRLEEDLGVQARVPTHLWHPKIVPPDHDLPTIAVSPVLINRRMLAQRAAFMICGDSLDPIEDTFPTAITKIVLPASTFEDAQRFLALAGIDPFAYFPDLEGIAMKFRQYEGETRTKLRVRFGGKAG